MSLGVTLSGAMLNSTALSDSGDSGDYSDDYTGSAREENGYVRAERLIWIVGGCLLLVLGSLGNVLTLVVLSRPKLRSSNATVYLMVVAVADLAALYTGLLRQLVLTISDTDLRHHGEFSCKLHTSLVYFLLDFSSWTLAALSLERLFSVCRPHSVKRYCSRMTSAGVISAIAIILLAINAHFLFLFGDLTVTLGPSSVTLPCVPQSQDYYRFVTVVWPWVDLTIFALLPLTVHILCNIFIVRSVLASFKQARRTRGIGIAESERRCRANRASSASAQSFSSFASDTCTDMYNINNSPVTASADCAVTSSEVKQSKFSRTSLARKMNNSTKSPSGQHDGISNNVITDIDVIDNVITDNDVITGNGFIDNITTDNDVTKNVTSGNYATNNGTSYNGGDAAQKTQRTTNSTDSGGGKNKTGSDHDKDILLHHEPAAATPTTPTTTQAGREDARKEPRKTSVTFQDDQGQTESGGMQTDHLHETRADTSQTPSTSLRPQQPAPPQDQADGVVSKGRLPYMLRRDRSLKGQKHQGAEGDEESGGKGQRGLAAKRQQTEEEKRMLSMTCMLVAASVVFCVTTIPISICIIVNWILVKRGQDYAFKPVLWAAVNILMYTNNSINFILYSLSGSRFRAELRALWGSVCRRCAIAFSGHPESRRRASSCVSYTVTSSQLSSLSSQSQSTSVTGRRWSNTTTTDTSFSDFHT